MTPEKKQWLQQEQLISALRYAQACAVMRSDADAGQHWGDYANQIAWHEGFSLMLFARQLRSQGLE